jgi:hypothetical protein
MALWPAGRGRRHWGALFDASVDCYEEFFVLGGLALYLRSNTGALALSLLVIAGEADCAPLRKATGENERRERQGRRSIPSCEGNPSPGRIVGTGVRQLHRFIAFQFEPPLTLPRRFVPRTIALIGMLSSLGCAISVQPGLTNVPALSISPVADANVHDVVANGRDSCERGLRPRPRRYPIPECPYVEHLDPTPGVVSVAPPSATVMPWLEHYYSRWPCSHSEHQANHTTLANPASAHVASDRGLILTCAGPL